jgi:DUF4097 and DUF4098 domain-containing protein YvlB
MNVNLHNGSGEVNISGVEGSLVAKTGSGNVSVNGVIQRADLIIGSGDLSIEGLKGDCSIKMGSGNGTVRYSSLPSSGSLRVNVGSGDLKVLIPKRAKVMSKIQIGSGLLKNELDNQESGTFLIEGAIGSGEIHLKN